LRHARAGVRDYWIVNLLSAFSRSTGIPGRIPRHHTAGGIAPLRRLRRRPPFPRSPSPVPGWPSPISCP